MRKILSLTIVMALSVSLFGQKQLPFAGPVNQKIKKTVVTEPIGAVSIKKERPSSVARLKNTKAINAIDFVEMGSSINPYTLLVQTSTCLTANQATGLISFTARTNNQVAGINGNHIGCYFSVDGGSTFENNLVRPYQVGTAGQNARYPSGVIYNPAGNTDAANAYAIVAGPMVTTDWAGAYFASQKFDGTLRNEQVTLFTTDNVDGMGYVNRMPRQFMQMRGDKVFVLGDDNSDNGTVYTGFRSILNYGVWNNTTNSVDWNRTSIKPDFGIGPDGYAEGSGTFGLVMDNAGVNGYQIFTGRNPDATDTLSFQPLIYKTTDGGATWTKDVFNWNEIPTIVDYITSINDGSNPLRPSFTSVLDATVDYFDRVHFTCFINGAASDHVDSLGYYMQFANLQGIVFDIHQTATGWDAMVVDTVWAKTAEGYFFSGTPDAIDCDERFQMSRTADGRHIIYAWMDTDEATGTTNNEYPDFLVKVFEVTNGTNGQWVDINGADKLNVTTGTIYESFAYWLYLSDISLIDGNNLITVPMSTSVIGGASTDPATHYYIKGVEIAGLPLNSKLVESNPVSVNMYPNPANDNVTLSINTVKDQTATVTFTNVLGQIAFSELHNLTNGNNVINLNVNSLSAGIYNVNITAGNQTVNKMIVVE